MGAKVAAIGLEPTLVGLPDIGIYVMADIAMLLVWINLGSIVSERWLSKVNK